MPWKYGALFSISYLGNENDTKVIQYSSLFESDYMHASDLFLDFSVAVRHLDSIFSSFYNSSLSFLKMRNLRIRAFRICEITMQMFKNQKNFY